MPGAGDYLPLPLWRGELEGVVIYLS